MLKVGIVGAGLISRHHAMAIESLHETELAAVCDPQLDRARLLAPTTAIFPDWRELAGSGQVDAVVIAVPHALHAEIAMGFIQAGIHVLLEKPMATSITDCDQLIKLSAATGTVLAVAHVQRFLRRNIEARERISSGAVGEPRLVVDRRTSQYEPGSRPPWFFDAALSGGGIVMNVGIHCIDRIHYLTGQRTQRVHAITSAWPGSGVETEAAIMLELTGGVGAVISLTGTGGLQCDRTEIICSKGAVIAEHDLSEAFRRPEEELVSARANDAEEAFLAQLSDFASAIANGQRPAADGHEGRFALITAHAVYEAALTGRVVTIP